MALAQRLSGLDLLVRRKSVGLRQEDVAARMGVGRTRVATLEGMYLPPRPAVERYLRAIDVAIALPSPDSGAIIDVGVGRESRASAKPVRNTE